MTSLPAVYDRLKEFREREDLELAPTRFLKSTFTGFDGEERELKLRYYQVQGVLHLFAMTRFLLGDDCGLGKTLQTIAALCFVWEKEPNRKAIILTTKSAVGQWEKEFSKFCNTDGINILRVPATPAKKREQAYVDFESSEGPTVMIMGYSSARQDISRIQQWSDFVVIFDEATAFKSVKSQIHKVCAHIAFMAAGEDPITKEWRKGRVWALTATLIKNNLMEGYGIYSVVVPGLFQKSLNKFISHYCVTRMQKIGNKRQIPVVVGYRSWAPEDFREKIDPYYIGRAKHQVAKELPPITIQVEHVGLTKLQKTKYKEALEGLLEIDKTGEQKETTKLTALIYCQQIVDHPDLIDCDGDSEKLNRLVEMVTEGDFAEENIIVYSRFKKMINKALPVLRKKGVPCVSITGDQKSIEERQEIMDKFQDPNDETRVILINDAAGEAINLQSAKLMIFYDSPWSAGQMLQVLGRMSRIGSLHDRIYAIHLCAKGTIDDTVLQVLKKKMGLIDAVMGKRIKGEESEMIVTDQNDISELFSALREDAIKMVG